MWLLADRLSADRAHERLVVQAETLAGAIELGATNVEVDLGAVAGLFEASETVTAEEFATMVERIQAAAGLAGIAYVPLVKADDLSEFIAKPVPSNPAIRCSNSTLAGEPTPVTARSTYFPVRYFHPSDVAGPMGLDVASVPDRLPFITEAVTSKEAVTTPMTTVAVFDGEGYVVYQPILDPNGDVTGLVVGPVLIEPLIQAVCSPCPCCQCRLVDSHERSHATSRMRAWSTSPKQRSAIMPGGSRSGRRRAHRSWWKPGGRPRCSDWPVWPSRSWPHLQRSGSCGQLSQGSVWKTPAP